MRKSRLFSLLCAFWPGAGEMYLGLMKRGIGIMILFWFALAIGATMFPWIIFIMPVLWFYSFCWGDGSPWGIWWENTTWPWG